MKNGDNGMKKIVLTFSLAALTAFGTVQAKVPADSTSAKKKKTEAVSNKNTKEPVVITSSGAENTKNKMTHNKVVRKTGQGISHGYYVLTHNFLSKFLHVNEGNVKYKNKNDIGADRNKAVTRKES